METIIIHLVDSLVALPVDLAVDCVPLGIEAVSAQLGVCPGRFEHLGRGERDGVVRV